MPDPAYKNLIDDNFYISPEVQSDCCVFFKMIDTMEVDGTSTQTLVNTYICSKDENRCF